MPDKKPLILLSNDDGWRACGLHVLIDCVSPLADVVAVAPAEPQSGKSSAITVGDPLHIRLEETYNGTPVYSVNGTPVDCVKLALHTLMKERRPDALFTGVNHGSNAGNSVIYSGTMGAAMEGCMVGIPSAGFSLLDFRPDADFSHCRRWISEIASRVLSRGLPQGVCLNVNFPADTEIEGLKVCRAARGYWTEEFADTVDPYGRPTFWLTGHYHNLEPEADDTDEYWLARRHASVVAARTDMTALDSLSTIKDLLK